MTNSFSNCFQEITSGAFEGLFSREVSVMDEKGVITYTEQVPEIGQEPDYDSESKLCWGDA